MPGRQAFWPRDAGISARTAAQIEAEAHLGPVDAGAGGSRRILALGPPRILEARAPAATLRSSVIRPPSIGPLPPGYRHEASPRGALALLASLAPRLRAVGFDLDGDGPLAPSRLRGRRPLQELEVARERFVLRRFSHGGLLRWLTGARFLDPRRPFDELRLSCELIARGVRTPEVVAARARRTGLGWRLAILTRRVEDSVDFGEVLARLGRGGLSPRARQAVLGAAGVFARELHEAGLHHADLNPRNLLVEREALAGGAARLWVIDLDRSKMRPAVSEHEARDNLRRLYRHVARLEREEGLAISRADLARFLRAYHRGSRAWREAWRAIERAHRRSGWVHRATWALERRFGRSRKR